MFKSTAHCLVETCICVGAANSGWRLVFCACFLLGLPTHPFQLTTPFPSKLQHSSVRNSKKKIRPSRTSLAINQALGESRRQEQGAKVRKMLVGESSARGYSP